ncbi:MAG TPA: hypothetical protein VJK05_05670 [archaeon]|nr:hypothetical protein [archaeon]
MNKKKKIQLDESEGDLEKEIQEKEENEEVEKPSDNIYSEKEREEMLEEGSVDDYELGFMQGYERAEKEKKKFIKEEKKKPSK